MASIQTIEPDPDRHRRRTKFVVQWRDPEGQQRSKSFDSITAARKFKSEVETDMGRNEYVDVNKARATFETYARNWAKTCPGGQAYRASRLSLIENHLLGPLGELRMEQISADVLREVVANLRLRRSGKPMARSSAQSVTNLISAILRQAEEDGIYRRAPLPKRWPLPPPRAMEKSFLTPAEGDRFLVSFEPFWKPLVTFMLDTGCRWGEAVGLRERSLALDFDRVLIQESLAEVKGHFTIQPTKNRRARTLVLPPRTVEALREHLRLHPPGPEGFVFTMPSGAHIQRSRWRQRVWEPALKKSGIGKKITPHSLRHSHISQLIAAGVDVVRAARRAGHSRPSVTSDIYSHMFDQGDEDAVATWQTFWGQPDANVTDLAPGSVEEG